MIVHRNQRFTKPVDKSKHYITNEDIMPLILEHKRTKKMTSQFAEILVLIANRLSHSPNFRGYEYKEDCIQDALLCCIKYIHNFDVDKSSNPFGYITEIMKFAFLGRINKENSWSKIKQKSRMYDSDGILIINEDFNKFDDPLFHNCRIAESHETVDGDEICD